MAYNGIAGVASLLFNRKDITDSDTLEKCVEELGWWPIDFQDDPRNEVIVPEFSHYHFLPNQTAIAWLSGNCIDFVDNSGLSSHIFPAPERGQKRILKMWSNVEDDVKGFFDRVVQATYLRENGLPLMPTPLMSLEDRNKLQSDMDKKIMDRILYIQSERDRLENLEEEIEGDYC